MAKYNNDKKFDVDLEYGQQREKEIANILEKGKLEVKSERSWWWRTKNIAIEIEIFCHQRTRSSISCHAPEMCKSTKLPWTQGCEKRFV